MEYISNVFVNEMSTMKPEDTGLPTVIWVDEGSNPQHGPRIKFKASNDQISTRDFTSMPIIDPSKIFNFPKKANISNKGIKQIQEFVSINKDLLLQLSKGEINYSADF